ncbi:MAG: EamA family transporter [Candidatus Kerfeldbacteria bacterium]|nr:EamA family transporter [Candidatus Kerfeldbacteria bacterium]
MIITHYMGEYFFYATLSPFLWAIVNIIDDYQIKKIYKNPSLAIIMTGLFLFVPLIISAGEANFFETKSIIFGIISGIAIVLSNWFYFKALSREETSIVIALWTLTPVIVYVLSFIFLGEVLNTRQSIGSGIIIVGSLLISLFGKKYLRFSPTLIIMLFASMLYAVNALLEKETYNNAGTFFSGFFFITLGMIIATLCFLCSKKNLYATVSVFKYNKRYLSFIVISEIINIAAMIFQDIALSLGSVTIVKVIEGLQPIFVLTLILFLSFFVVYFRTNTNYKLLFPKLLIMAGMMFGLYLIY